MLFVGDSVTFDLPLNAIKTFESWSQLKVTIHDFENSLLPYLPKEVFIHGQPCCMKIKNSGKIDKCVSFDREFLYTYPSLNLVPRVHCCHAGIVEWSVVIHRDDQIAWMIFAGQRKIKKEIKGMIFDKNKFSQVEGFDLGKMPMVSQDESDFYLEGICQLATRLNDWHLNTAKMLEVGAKSSKHPDVLRIKVSSFILENHKNQIKLADLAKHLFLSESRTAHLIKLATGSSFVEILTEVRIKTAINLLSYTKLPVSEVALNSGFNDISHFHRVFRKYNNISPRLFRVNSQFV